MFSKEPLKSPMRIFVIGDGGEGKSTLIEAMEHEPRFAALTSIIAVPKEVNGVSQKTAGIIPRVFKSRLYGDVLFYDFAGQEAYYSSHAAVIKSAVDKRPPIFILVTGLHREDTALIHSVSYWLGIIINQCAAMEGKAQLIVVGSHSDLIEERNEVDRRKQIIFRAVQNFTAFNLVDVIPMDCRYSISNGMKSLRHCVGRCCDSLRSKLSISLNAHMFLIYLLDKHSFSAAFSLEKIQADLEEEINQTTSQKLNEVLLFIPTTIPRLIEICTQLNDSGHILFLPDELLPERSFIVINKNAILAEINGTMFAPEDFTQHCQLATSTGIVPRSKLAKHFPNFNTKMLIRFLSYFELAVPIKDQQVLSLVDQQLGESATTAKEEYLFCPALIRLEVPHKVFASQAELKYHFGWILSCLRINDFLDARFLHVLILRLALSLGTAPATDPDFPALQHHCSVWKTGVSWNTTSGINVLVEVVKKKKVVLLIKAHANSIQLYKLRFDVIRKIRETASEFCSSVVTEELILSPTNVVYPIEESITITAFSLKSVAETVVNREPFVVSASGNETLPLKDLLSAEVYANLGESLLQLLFNPAFDSKIPDSFFSILCSSWGKSAQLEDLICSAIKKEIITEDQGSSEKLRVVLGTWKDQSDGTYKTLRRVLDSLSVFAGRNPLVS